MMFSAEKCSDLSTGTSEATEHQTGGSEGLGKEGVPPDEVASAVAAVSDEIGDILKDELGDADRADRIGAELAGLSAELGLLAGLADGEPQQDFPSLFEIAMGHRVSGSGTSSSSSWSGGGARRASRPQRAPRRKPIAKGKEISRRRSAAARRAASMRVRRVEVVSDASDVGADSDSDGQWTELEDACSSDNSSTKDAAQSFESACNGYQHKAAEAEPPAMGQFLLPLLSAAPAPAPDRTELFIRHEDILQAVRLAPLHLLTSSEEGARVEFPLQDDTPLDQTDSMSEELDDFEEPPVTPEEEAALLHYVCEAERLASWSAAEPFTPVAEWLLGVYHAWCEISALMYTLIGCNMSVEMVREDWVYRARFGCHCRLCLCLANNSEALARFLRPLLTALARDSSTIPTAVALMRALRISDAGAPCRHAGWRLRRLRRLRVPDAGLAIIHAELLKLEGESEMTSEIVNKVCLCRPVAAPLRIDNAMERLCQILENFKEASTITFQVEIIPSANSVDEWFGEWRSRLERYLRPFQRCSTAARLRDMLARPTPQDLSAWAGYRHKCDCLTPRSVCAQQRKLLLRISFFGMMQAVNEFNSGKPDESADGEKAPNEEQKETGSRELQQGDGTGAKPPDSTEGQPASPDKEYPDQDQDSDSKSLGDLDDLSESDGGSGSLGLSSSSLDSASSLLLAAAAAVESGGEDLAPGSLCRTVRHLMRSIASIERLMDRVLKHCDEWPASAHCRRDSSAADERSARYTHTRTHTHARKGVARKRVDMGLSEVDRKLMAMYRRLPEVHRRQLQVYRKQKKLSTLAPLLTKVLKYSGVHAAGGRARAGAPPPGSPPPPPAHQACRALCPEYHLQRFQEVRRKVMHMRDQQLYYHRLRLWLEQQLRRERDKLPDSNTTESSLSLVEQAARKRRSVSPKPKLGAAPKRKLKPPSKPQQAKMAATQLCVAKRSEDAYYVTLLGTGLLSEPEVLGRSSHAGPMRIGKFTYTIELLRRFVQASSRCFPLPCSS
ncbi:hypothetical protein MSG28_015848 [Choristoneura fumiferana]|uniref:Uncharacterized protein n=1 Tax=Choristoneura fumiferana TaxID=7141 RepID=A0ACC0K4J6_CHOFU|nr:hypothetical protein MSG28_015848 [Choristoneura fumiferana]